MTTKKYIIANWKNTKTVSDCISWVNEVGSRLGDFSDYEIVVCPSYLAIESVSRLIQEKGFVLRVGSQSVSKCDVGAFTGEVGAFALAGIAQYALLGHSERRSHFHETNEDVARQVSQCTAHAIVPIVLIRDSSDILPDNVTLFAWEPVSAIGTGKAVLADEAGTMISKLAAGRTLRGIYGGSVNVENISAFMTHPLIEGVLIGSASNEASRFMEMIDALR